MLCLVIEQCIYHQVPANHLISASIISAPCALAISKLLMPETKKSKFLHAKNIMFENM